MTVHFAAARRAASSPVARILGTARISRASNDNGDFSQPLITEDIAATLRHFAEFGLGAGKEAQARALEAHAAGDAHSFDHWRDICRMLDRPAAQKLPEDTPA